MINVSCYIYFVRVGKKVRRKTSLIDKDFLRALAQRQTIKWGTDSAANTSNLVTFDIFIPSRLNFAIQFTIVNVTPRQIGISEAVWYIKYKCF